MKNKPQKTIENILGTLSILTLLHWIVSMMIPLPYNIWGTDSFEVVLRNGAILWVITSIVFILFYFISHAKMPKPEPESILRPEQFGDYQDTFHFFDNKMKTDGYNCTSESLKNEKGEVFLYSKQLSPRLIDGIVILRTEEILSENHIMEMGEMISELFDRAFDQDILFVEVQLINIFCVDRNSKALKDFIQIGAVQRAKRTNLYVSIPFNDANIYIAGQESGLGKIKHQALREKFLSLIKS